MAPVARGTGQSILARTAQDNALPTWLQRADSARRPGEGRCLDVLASLELSAYDVSALSLAATEVRVIA